MIFRLPVLLLFLCLYTPALPSSFDQNAEALLDQGHYKRARVLIEPMYKANPNDAHLAHLLSRALWELGDEKGGLEMAERSVTLDPKVPEYHIHYSHLYGQLLDDASTFGKVSILRKFRKELDIALSLNPNHLDALILKAVFLWEAPVMVGGDRKKAEEIAAQLPGIDAERGHLYVARLAQNQKDWGRMEAEFRKVLAINPRSYNAVARLAFLYCCRMDQPRWNDAEHYGREAIQLDPSRAAGYGALAASYAGQQRWADLDAIMAQVERTIPEDLSPYYYAAKTLRTTSTDLPRAERYLQKYLSHQPEGDTPTHIMARWELALVDEKEGRKTDAAKEMEAVLAAKPNWELARKDLKRLK